MKGASMSMHGSTGLVGQAHTGEAHPCSSCLARVPLPRAVTKGECRDS